jgi:hypothetical protein
MATTELAAVNQIIGAVGQAPVTSLNSPNPEISIARSTLQDVNREIQAEGWAFNSEKEYPFVLDVNGEVPLPDNVLSISLSRLPENMNIEVTRRNGKLYNKLDHTYVWDQIRSPLKCDVVWLFELEDVPQPVIDYIVSRASVIACGRLLGDTDQYKLLKDREIYTRSVALESDLREARPTMFGWPNGSNPGLPYRPFQVIAR